MEVKKMKVSYELRDNYLYVKAAGEFTPSATKDIFFNWVEKAHSHALNRILCNITLITGFDAQQMSTMDRFNTSKLIVESIPKDFMLAILETPEQLERYRFGENDMVNRGTTVKATSNMNEALKWLGVA